MEKSILVSIIAVFAVLTLMTCTSATDIDEGNLVDITELTINGANAMNSITFAVEAGETIPIKIVFDAVKDASDVTVKAWIDGYRREITSKTKVFELVNGSEGYTKYLSLTVPADIDPTEDYTLRIEITGRETETEDKKVMTDGVTLDLKLQRESYNLDVLSVEAPQSATPGSTVAVDIVLKNWGMHDLEDIFVKVRIPDLGIERKVYFGDLDPLDECEYNDGCDGNREDAVERRVFLQIPDNAKSGIYSLEVEAFNVDSTEIVKKSLVISGVEQISNVLAGAGSKSLAAGQEVTYEFVIVNSGSKMKVYTLAPEAAEGLIIEVDPIAVIPADSSKTVTVKVKATESVTEGTHVATVRVESEGSLVKSVSFSANVEKAAVSSSVVVLTIVLAIVFVVLLIILIVLLTRKPAAAEAEETSYY